jgi:hypothetical protein
VYADRWADGNGASLAAVEDAVARELLFVLVTAAFTWPVNHQPYPMVQLLTIGDLLGGQRPKMPTPFLPYIQAKRLAAPTEQLTLG